MLIHYERLDLTTSSGEASGNTQKLMGVVLGIYVKPATSTTQYTITITDEAGMIVYVRTEEIGDIADDEMIAVKEIYTISITGATKDEAFLVRLGIREE